MIPVTQKKVIIPAINMNISHCPISTRVRWVRLLLVKIMLIIRKTTGFINWKSCNPDILSINFNLLKPEFLLNKIYLITLLS
jgi:hypothetical protein